MNIYKKLFRKYILLRGAAVFLMSIVGAASASASTVYWSVFNIEDERDLPAALVTYSSVEDMLNDTNRTGVHDPDGYGNGRFGRNIVGGGSDGDSYWNLFNIEGENDLPAAFVTYSTFDDMLNDTNRSGVYDPVGYSTGRFGRNIVGSGSDGSVYWNVFNIEGERDLAAAFVTYDTREDMLNDTNRTGVYDPVGYDSGRFGRNIVGSGSDGNTYWSVFNIEGEDDLAAAYVTYASLLDMLNDTNRTGVYDPVGYSTGRFGRNIVGSGAFTISTVPLPAALPLFATILSGFGVFLFRRRKAEQA